MVRDTLTLEDLELCRKTLDTARVNPYNRFIIHPERMEDLGYYKTSGTEPMTTTTETTTTTTARTSADILKDLRAGTYITEDNNFIVSNDWGDSIRVAYNPLASRFGLNRPEGNELNLSDKSLKELLAVQNLLKLDQEAKDATNEIEWAVRDLNAKESV